MTLIQQDLRLISARFRSKCAASGVSIARGVLCAYDPIAKKVYAAAYYDSLPCSRADSGSVPCPSEAVSSFECTLQRESALEQYV